MQPRDERPAELERLYRAVRGWNVNPERLGVFVIVATGLLAALLKAWLAPLTVDEAWTFNAWIARGPAHIWTDYSQANNHILHNLAAWCVTRVCGTSPLALRLPALLGRALFLAAGAGLLRVLVRRPLVRLAGLLTLALHPYLLDFGVLARGYAPAMGLLTAGVYLLAAAGTTAGRCACLRRPVVAAGLASLCFGLAAGCVPLAAPPAAAALAAWIVFYGGAAPRRPVWVTAAAALPAVLVTALTYRHAAAQVTRSTFYFGTVSVAESVASLGRILLYLPQGRVDADGYPDFGSGVFFHPWDPGRLSDFVYAAAAQAPWAWLAPLVCLAAVLVLLAAGRRRGGAAQGLLAATLLFALPPLFLGLTFFGARLPWNRTWVLLLCFFPPALFAAADRAGPVMAGVLAGGLAVVLNLNALDRLDLHTFWEWPDNAVVPGALHTIAMEREAGDTDVSVGYPPYLNACLLYYRERFDYGWLRVAPGAAATKPVWDYIILNRGNMAAERYEVYRSVRTYPALEVTLLRHAQPQGG